jgi:hypothetical protein
VNEVQLAVGFQAGTGEVGRADDAEHRPEAVEERSAMRVAVEKVTLGVQEAGLVEADLNPFLAQEADQVLDQGEGFGPKRLGVEHAAERLLQRRQAGFEADVLAGLRLGAEQQTEAAELFEAVREKLEAADVEVGGGDVEGQVAVVGEDLVEDVGELVAVVVDDVGEGAHGGGQRGYGFDQSSFPPAACQVKRRDGTGCRGTFPLVFSLLRGYCTFVHNRLNKVANVIPSVPL